MIVVKFSWVLVVLVILQTKLFGQAVNYCGYNTCYGSGYCHEEIDSYYCECLPGFSGQNCREVSTWNRLSDVRMEKIYDEVPNVGLIKVEVNNSGIYGYICHCYPFLFFNDDTKWLCRTLGCQNTAESLYDYNYYNDFVDVSSYIGYGVDLLGCFWNDQFEDISNCAFIYDTCRHSWYYPDYLPLIHCSDFGIVCNITDDCGSAMEGLVCIDDICRCGEGYSVNATYWFCEKDCGIQHIDNGNFIALNGTTEGATANIVCNEGYTLVGSAVIVCESNGKWNDTTMCQGIDKYFDPDVENIISNKV